MFNRIRRLFAESPEERAIREMLAQQARWDKMLLPADEQGAQDASTIVSAVQRITGQPAA